jgi:release factor glutamine methyltransferase
MTYHDFLQPFSTRYEQGEAKAVARMILEVGFGLSMTDIVCGAVEQLSANDQKRLRQMQARVLDGEPVQYVLGVADFGPRQFIVAPGVLIPRPETYELCQWVVENVQCTMKNEECRTLDIGTGSGCIASTLAAELPKAEVSAWDISEQALDIARQNAERLQVSVTFEQRDILAPQAPPPEKTDILVSNPPYICRKEAQQMEPHVLEHEPHLALFVPDDDPLLFYRAIADYARQALKPTGKLFFEINPLYAGETVQMLQSLGFPQTEIRRDQFGKERFVKALNFE